MVSKLLYVRELLNVLAANREQRELGSGWCTGCYAPRGWAGMALWSELFVFWTVLVGGSGVSRCTVHVFGRF